MDYTIEDFLKDGESGGKVPKNVSEEAIEKGTEVELEHTTNRDIARKIALDHLAEFPDYYERLEKMEAEARKMHKVSASSDSFEGAPPVLPLTISQIRDQVGRPDIVYALGKADGRRFRTKDNAIVGVGAAREYEKAYENARMMLGSVGNVNELDAFFGPGQVYIVVLSGVKA